jgi:hypothetical protein
MLLYHSEAGSSPRGTMTRDPACLPPILFYYTTGIGGPNLFHCLHANGGSSHRYLLLTSADLCEWRLVRE